MSQQNVTVKISERQKRILNIVKENPNILQTELAERFGVRRETVHRDMKKLVDAGILSRSDSDKKCNWKVAKNFEFRRNVAKRKVDRILIYSTITEMKVVEVSRAFRLTLTSHNGGYVFNFFSIKSPDLLTNF